MMRFIFYTLQYLFLLFFLQCFCLPTLVAQITIQLPVKKAQLIADKLTAEGFQSVSIRYFKGGYVVAYENRVYRFDALALKRVMTVTAAIIGEDPAISKVFFITKRTNIPMVSTEWTLNESGLSEEGTLKPTILPTVKTSQDIKAATLGEQIVGNQNTGNYKAELVLRPYLSMELGNRYTGDNFIHLFDIRPKLNIYLWKGAHFTGEFIVPISSEFKETAPHWSEFRTRIVALSQQVRVSNDLFLNASIGAFSRNRYGVSTTVGKYFWNNQLLLSGKVGYTGHLSYVRYNGREVIKNWGYTPLNYLDYKMGIHYWLPKRNTQIGIEYGKVLNERTVVFFKCRQQFKEMSVGFFAFKTDQGRNYGMDISIPIFPRKYRKPKLFSIRPAKAFQYQYLSGYDSSKNVNLAREYQAQGMYEGFPQDLNPAFLKLELLRE